MLSAMFLWLVAIALGALGIRRFFAGYSAAPVGVRTLSAPEYQTASAAAQVLYPEGGAIAASGGSARVALHTDGFVGAQTSGNRILMRLLLVLIEHATLVFPAHGPHGRRRFSALDSEQQLAYLEGWRGSETAARRLVFTSLRAILTMGYFADPEVLRSLGLAPRDIERSVIEADLLWPPIGEHPRSIPFSARDLTGRVEEGRPLGPTGPLHPDFR